VFVTLQYLLPHHLLCRLVYALSRSQRTWLKNALIRAFVRHYRPQLADALDPEPLHYPSFNAFFTRALKPGARPMPPVATQLVSPCDGIVGQTGLLVDEELLQAKGHRYRLSELLATPETAPEAFRGGHYATLYLAPYHYHRVHMPLAGTLRSAWHVPGRLFSVNDATRARVPRLFARNERVICLFDGEHGPFALILVGALFVGSMSTVWHGEITPWRPAGRTPAPLRAVHRLEPSSTVERFQARGAELGRFNMGSTVVLLLSAALRWEAALGLGAAVRVGQPLATWLPDSAGPP
jgi:phosphatidylserine decarboxylase